MPPGWSSQMSQRVWCWLPVSQKDLPELLRLLAWSVWPERQGVLWWPVLQQVQMWQALPGRLTVRGWTEICGRQWSPPLQIATGRNRPDHRRRLWPEPLMRGLRGRPSLSEPSLPLCPRLVEPEVSEFWRLGAGFVLRRGFLP